MCNVGYGMIIPYPTLHTSVALGGVASPRGGETRKRLDEPTPDQVRGDERRAAPAPAPLRQDQGPGRETPNSGLNSLVFVNFSPIICYLWAKSRILC